MARACSIVCSITNPLYVSKVRSMTNRRKKLESQNTVHTYKNGFFLQALPFLIPLSIENGLTVAQYDTVRDLIKDMLTRCLNIISQSSKTFNLDLWT